MLCDLTHTRRHTNTHRRMFRNRESVEQRRGFERKENRKRENRDGNERLINPPFGGVLKTLDSAADPLSPPRTCLLLREVV